MRHTSAGSILVQRVAGELAVHPKREGKGGGIALYFVMSPIKPSGIHLISRSRLFQAIFHRPFVLPKFWGCCAGRDGRSTSPRRPLRMRAYGTGHEISSALNPTPHHSSQGNRFLLAAVIRHHHGYGKHFELPQLRSTHVQHHISRSNSSFQRSL